MDIDLGVESEWGRNKDMWHDFGKLLVVKAPLKLMVFDKQASETTETIEECCMREFTQHVEGEHYLLLEFDTRNEETHAFPFRVPSNGRLDAVTFRRFPPIL
jgi:hypothetical protein